MKNEDDDPKVLRLIDYKEDASEEDTEVDPYPPECPDLREIADRVESQSDLKKKFVEIYVSFDDDVVEDCNITERGFTIYTQDDTYVYGFTVIKKP